jgi:hypothetical protein
MIDPVGTRRAVHLCMSKSTSLRELTWEELDLLVTGLRRLSAEDKREAGETLRNLELKVRAARREVLS